MLFLLNLYAFGAWVTDTQNYQFDLVVAPTERRLWFSDLTVLWNAYKVPFSIAL